MGKNVNMFENVNENQKKFDAFLKTEEGQKCVKGFLEGPTPNYSRMFANMTLPEKSISQNAIPEADRPKLDDLNMDEATGAVLKPGEPELCEGNGFHINIDGDAIECACDECDYLQQCFSDSQES